MSSPCRDKTLGNFGLNGGVPWLTNTDGELCLFCKNSVEDVSHFLSDCSSFRDNFESLWLNLSQKIIACNPSDKTQISHFISSLDRQQKIILLFIGGLPLPFDGVIVTMINRFISSAVGKIYRLRKEMLSELEAHGCPSEYIYIWVFFNAMYFWKSHFFSVTSSYYFTHY